ncbi:MAG: hypothetical protein O3B44_00465 [Bacteroidetes bacterium]|nr:hypothetical protein [Bacteroidota bacterium]
MEYVKYRDIRDKYWFRYYPSSKTLYNILNFITFLFIIIGILLFVGTIISFTDGGLLSGIFGLWVGGVFVAILIQIFIFSFLKEMIKFQVDKNFYYYVSCSEDLKKIVEDEKSE